jgi:hypothetical protein
MLVKNVVRGTSSDTDECHLAYNDLRLRLQAHDTVNHSAKSEYVRAVSMHTNTIEGHWGTSSARCKGTHVHISGKHMWKYVAEFTYRRNFRHSHVAMFDRLVAAFALPRLRQWGPRKRRWNRPYRTSADVAASSLWSATSTRRVKSFRWTLGSQPRHWHILLSTILRKEHTRIEQFVTGPYIARVKKLFITKRPGGDGRNVKNLRA